MRSVRCAALAAVATMSSGCSDPTATGELAIMVDTLSIWALNGGPISYPAAVLLLGDYIQPTAARVTADGFFDVALDIDTAGRVVLLPIARVLPQVNRVVAIQPVTTAFEALGTAPERGYLNDSAAVAVVGTTLAIGAETDGCSGQVSTVTYAKLVIDHIDRAARRIDVRVAVNPNCGLRALKIPDD